MRKADFSQEACALSTPHCKLQVFVKRMKSSSGTVLLPEPYRLHADSR
jgi:hypothetical protein